MISKYLQRSKLILIDYITANISFFLFDVCRYFIIYGQTGASWGLWSYLLTTKMILEQLFMPFLLLAVNYFVGVYNKPFIISRIQALTATFATSFFSTVIIYLALLVNDPMMQRSLHYKLILAMFLLFFFVTYIGRYIVITHNFRMIKERRWAFKTLIVGNSEKAHQVAEKLARSQSIFGYHTIGFIELDDENNVTDSDKPVYKLEQVEEVVNNLGVTQIIIAPEEHDEHRVLRLVRRLYPLDATLKVAANTFNYLSAGIRTQDVYGEPLIELSSPTISESSKNCKRALDVLFSTACLAVLSIPMLVIAIMVKRDSKGPVFYSQTRIGYRQKPFRIYKFRTMRNDAEVDGPQLSSPNDRRVTPLGKWMRKYRIDELPQFWNVLKGDMSIVGPRPERAFFIERIVKKAPYYTLLHQVRPGITSWGMVRYGYARDVDEMVERCKYDLLYISNMTLTVDLKILVYTIKTVVTGRGM